MEEASQYLSLGHYSPNTIRNYLTELRYLFVYFADVSPHDFSEDMIMEYLLYLTRSLGCSLPTTMLYMHLTVNRTQGLVNLYDALPKGNDPDNQPSF